MTRLAILVAFLLGAQARAAEQLHLALPGLTALGMPASRGTFFNEHLASGLLRLGVRVSTAKSISEVLGAERQRQLLGCADSGCVVELANALGADGIVSGEVALVGKSIQVNVKVISSRNGDVLEAVQARVSSEEAVLDALDDAAEKLGLAAANTLGRELRPTPLTGGVRQYAWAPAVVGVLAGATGTILLVMANGKLAAIPQTPGQTAVTYEAAQVLANDGQTLQTAGWVFASVGAAALVGAGGMFLFGAGKQAPVTVAFAPGPGGAGVVLGGSF